jgi:hypothetical protein
MFNRQTLFVLGAGSSAEVDLPNLGPSCLGALGRPPSASFSAAVACAGLLGSQEL